MIKRFIVLFLICFICSVQAFGKISFGVSDINSNDEVLFTVKQEMTGINPYKSLFCAKIDDGQAKTSPSLLTCYPEQMEILANGKILQIRNRYGRGFYYADTSMFQMIETYTSLPDNSFPLSPYAVSPDGSYYCYIDKKSLGYGNLILQDAITGKNVVLCENTRQSFEKIPVKWSLDGSILLYEKDNKIYFCKPDAILRGVEMDENYRVIGRGSINCVNWASSKSIVYINDYLVYEINSRELYTLGLYSGILGQGKAIGRLPYQFNSLTDKFSVDKNISSLVLIQNNRMFSYLKFKKDCFDYMDIVYNRPYSDSSASLLDAFVGWSSDSTPILWLQQMPYDEVKEKSSVYKLSEYADFIYGVSDSSKPVFSPDGKKVAFYTENNLMVYDVSSWISIGSLSGDKIVSIKWANNSVLYAGGEKTTRRWNLDTNSIETAALSCAEAAYWDKTNNSIIAKLPDDYYYIYNKEKSIWTNISITNIEGSLQNENYRLFCGTTQNQHYENALYIRSLKKSAVTKPMYKESIAKTPVQKNIALVFDAYDNSDGLSKILETLNKYNVPATFFLNGEFIRRYPSETNQIACGNYAVGSMFFSQTDLVNNSFIVDENFIRNGLARNEDEFYNCTGKELSLFWHAPYYSVSSRIISYGEKAGYDYVTSLHDVNDSEKLSKDVNPEYLIQKYCDSLKHTGGGIVPVSIGFSQGNRADPLYNHLDILICSLIDAGFNFVTVEKLIN